MSVYGKINANVLTSSGSFIKNDSANVAFYKTGEFTVSTKSTLNLEVNGESITISSNTAVMMPETANTGTDYVIWATPTGTLEATTDFISPPVTNSRKIGGFHYAPGGNATTPITFSANTSGIPLPAETIPADKWGIYRFDITNNGTISVYSGANNTIGYDSQANAIINLPSVNNDPIGYITVLTANGQPWIAGTDSLAGGTGGNPSSNTAYFSESKTTLSRGTANTTVAYATFTYYFGANTTPQINEYSFWDLKFRPVCKDPRGMALIADAFWCDIYLTGVDAITNGSSKYNVEIADGSSPPKIPVMFGGTGSSTYGSYTWFEAQELAMSFGKRSLNYWEFVNATYGTTEMVARSGGDNLYSPNKTGIDTSTNNPPRKGIYYPDKYFTSKWGIIQSTGCLYIWGRERGGPYAAASWNANTEGRGSEYNAPNASLFGGNWLNSSYSGSRCSAWSYAASPSYPVIGSRFACDHLILD